MPNGAVQAFQDVMRRIERGRERAMRGEGGVALEDGLTRGGVAIDPMGGDTYRVGDTVHVRVPDSVLAAELSRQYIGAIDWASQTPPGGYAAFVAPVYTEAERSARRQPPAAPKDPARVAMTATPVDDEYRALAQRLGLDPTPVDIERFKAWVNERGLCVYDRGDVQRYLDHQYGVAPGQLTDYVRWGWRPLREADRKPRGLGSSEDAAPRYNGRLQVAVEPYQKAIPYPVLLTIDAVVQAFPMVRLFVSDDMRGEAIPDPFLLVKIGAGEFVIERWDEPAFRARR